MGTPENARGALTFPLQAYLDGASGYGLDKLLRDLARIRDCGTHHHGMGTALESLGHEFRRVEASFRNDRNRQLGHERREELKIGTCRLTGFRLLRIAGE